DQNPRAGATRNGGCSHPGLDPPPVTDRDSIAGPAWHRIADRNSYLIDGHSRIAVHGTTCSAPFIHGEIPASLNSRLGRPGRDRCRPVGLCGAVRGINRTGRPGEVSRDDRDCLVRLEPGQFRQRACRGRVAVTQLAAWIAATTTRAPVSAMWE